MVNNGAAALVLATTALAAGREVVVSRGELIEIGAGFRLPDLIASTGARLREVGTTNRTHLQRLRRRHRAGHRLRAQGASEQLPGRGVHRRGRRRRAAALADAHAVPLVADLGSGLLAPDPLLPDEPDAATALADGADVVTASGDKLLGGPQAGLVLGRAEIVARMARHPLARAVRADKLTLAALEATVAGGPLAGDRRPCTPTPTGCAPAPSGSPTRSAPPVVPHDGRVGGGGAPGVPLPGWAVRLPESAAARAAHRRPGGAAPGARRRLPARPALRARGRRRAAARRGPRGARRGCTARTADRMHVVATAGHVDHGKSTLVRALTGMEPDRWAEERRRGLTIDLGFAWTTLPSGREVAFVDVPGHERFLGNMLAGLGPAPVVCFVVAADEGWQAQSERPPRRRCRAGHPTTACW